MKVLVTGTAGFIGFHLAQALLARGDEVIGVDNVNDYYDVTLKERRLELLVQEGFTFYRQDLSEREALEEVFAQHRPARVVNLAAQAGVRYSIEHPRAYIRSNIDGFLEILECCRHHEVEHLVYASSSSVYGATTKIPFSVDGPTAHPVSLYAATKKSNEMMAHAYSHLYRLPTTGLRFFTVYGPWGRPDMAMFLFTKAILAGEPIKVFNRGDMERDFTYIDDIVQGVMNVLDRVPEPDPDWRGDDPRTGSSKAPYRLYNIGNNQPVELLRMISILEDSLGKGAQKELLPMQPGDVRMTYADIDSMIEDFSFEPKTSIEEGIARFVAWYRDFYG